MAKNKVCQLSEMTEGSSKIILSQSEMIATDCPLEQTEHITVTQSRGWHEHISITR